MGNSPYAQLGAVHQSQATPVNQLPSSIPNLNANIGAGQSVLSSGVGSTLRNQWRGPAETYINAIGEQLDKIFKEHGQMAAHNAAVTALNQISRRLNSKALDMRTYSLDLRIDFNDKARHDDIKKAMRRAAKQLFTQASLLSDGRTPEVALRSEDFFEGTSDIEVVTESDEDE